MIENKIESHRAPRQAWDLPVGALKGVGEKFAQLMARADVRTLWDLLLLLPRTYEDRRHFHSYVEMEEIASRHGAVLGKARIERYATRVVPGRRRWLEAVAVLEEESFPRHLSFIWFNDFGGSTQKRFPEGSHVIFRGKVQNFRDRLQVTHPELQKADAELPFYESGGFIPVYREISGIPTRSLRRIVAQAMDRPEFKNLPEALPQELCAKLGLPSLKESLRELHFPTRWEPPADDLRPQGDYYRRIVFEELFMMALALHFRRAEWRSEEEAQAHRVPQILCDRAKLEAWSKKLPFALTNDQRQALDEVLSDLALAKERVPMHRMVQGDVGSGKTIVAFLSALTAIEAGFQVALMAPTEILADQHYQNFHRLFPERAAEALLLKGALTEKQKREARQALESGRARFVIGTQALLSDNTLFNRLGFVIVDEQHRFGVEQRLGLKRRGKDELIPHLLVMTATPIPRSLALTLYGDLNVSIIREKPAGRTPVATHLVKRRAHQKLAERLQKFLDEGRQIYMVYPLVEENEELDLKDVQQAFKEWKAHFGPELAIDLLHGQMKSSQKEAAMRAFQSGETRVLICTTVIEVGVDVPNASVIVIEHAERFGLSQLHQLRGRVGRGSTQSYCVLVGPDHMGPLVEERLRTLESSEDGFFIAEKDLDIRGPGEFLGRKQSGLPGFRVAHILRDVSLMALAREEAKTLLDSDPRLTSPENARVRLMLEKWWKGRMELTLSG